MLSARRKVALFFVGAGLLAVALLGLLYVPGMTPQFWSRLFFGHFLLLVNGGMLLLAVEFLKGFDHLPLVDFLIGIAIYVLAISIVPWLGGLSLLGYGFARMRSR